MTRLIRDARSALHMRRNSSGFSVAAVATLAIGVEKYCRHLRHRQRRPVSGAANFRIPPLLPISADGSRLALHVQPSIGVHRAPGVHDRHSGSCATSCGNVSGCWATDISSGGDPDAGNCLVPARCPAARRVPWAGLPKATRHPKQSLEARVSNSVRSSRAWPGRPGAGTRARSIVLNVYVEPAWRRRGVAEALMRALLDALAVRGIRRIVLHASPDGRRLYERLGFVPTNEMRLSPR